ncbi:MAG: hypothetical protein NVSMB51_16910 [Solirubrobacteraceae bacterium]
MGYFAKDAQIRRVHGEQVLALYGPRALLMQAAHPLAFAGLMAHKGTLDAPYERLARTAEIMNTITFGEHRDALAAGRRVRAMHARVRGRIPRAAGRYPAGTPYAADAPELLLWILATLMDSAVVIYELYVGRLARAEQEALWQDYRRVGRIFGLRAAEMPRTLTDFEAYMELMLAGDELCVTDQARGLALRIVLSPPVPLFVRPLVEVANFITVGLLPERLRREYRLGWDPARSLLLTGGAQYARRVVLPLLPARLRLSAAARPPAHL